jgi:hypothetical protein
LRNCLLPDLGSVNAPAIVSNIENNVGALPVKFNQQLALPLFARGHAFLR